MRLGTPTAAVQGAKWQRGVPQRHAGMEGQRERLRKLLGHLREQDSQQNGERVREERAQMAQSLDRGLVRPERSSSACTARWWPRRPGPKAWPWEVPQGTSRLRAAPTCSYRLWLGHLVALEWPLTTYRTMSSLGQGHQREPPRSKA